MEIKTISLKLKSADASVITAFLTKLKTEYGVVTTSTMMFDKATKEFRIFANVILVNNEGA